MKYVFILLLTLLFITCKKGGEEHSGIEKNVKEDSPKSYEERGMEIALGTKTVLGKNLLGTIQKKGIQEAIVFCHVEAYPLTDSMADVYKARIKRVSDRYRNPSNKATSQETSLIAAYQEKLQQNRSIEPTIDSTGNVVQFYYPIVTDELCLQCHGNKNTMIDPNVLATIQSLYPEDHATGYETNQVRGLWSIRMEK